MKIISGFFKGRTIKGYDIDGTRPTMDRVKESLFGSIQNYVPNSVVLDLFSGSGNLGFEALSNNAKFCYFNDKNIKCCKLIDSIIKELGLNDKSRCFNMHYNKLLDYFIENKICFDIVFLDPPYKMDCLNEVVKKIYDNGLINKNGIIVCEIDTLYLNVNSLLKIKEKKYGNKYIVIYKNNV